MSDTTPRAASPEAADATTTLAPPDSTATPTTDAEKTDGLASASDLSFAEAAASDATADAIDAVFRTPPALPDAPEVSPDGARVAYLLADAAGALKLWLSPLDGGDAVSIALPFTPIPDRDPDTGRSLRGPQWSPDGATIALTGSHPDGNPLRTAVWLVPVPAAAAAAATATADAETVAAAADASETSEPVVASAAPAEDTSSADGAADARADRGTETTYNQAHELLVGEHYDAPAKIATADETADATPEAGAGAETPAAVDGPVALTVPTPLSDHPTASDRSPRWSPDGMLIAFVRRLDGHDVIALASPEGALPVAAELLTWSDSHDREPAWSRDGLFLAFTRKRLEDVEHNDILVFILATGEIRNLTGEKASAIRHSLDWVPGRNLIAFVTRENEWLSIAVINSDNKAGWTVTREAGDKVEPRFSPGEPRLVYIRTEGFASVVCERGLHASGAAQLDPGEGVGFYPRWVADKRTLYGFSAAQRPFGFLAQDNTADAERTAIELPGISPTLGREFRRPTTFEFEVGADAQFSGLLYR
ncbi:MAG: hypothetical protein WBA46_09735, partial [Thermomicrobiales bacterium]